MLVPLTKVACFASNAVLTPPDVTGLVLEAVGAVSKVSAFCLLFHAVISLDAIPCAALAANTGSVSVYPVIKPLSLVKSDVAVGTVMFAVAPVDALAVNVATLVPFF